MLFLHKVAGGENTRRSLWPGVINDDTGAVVRFLSSEFDQYRLMHFDTFFLDLPEVRHASADDTGGMAHREKRKTNTLSHEECSEVPEGRCVVESTMVRRRKKID